MKFSCYYCMASNADILATREQIRFKCYGERKWVLRCRECDLVQLWPQWTESETDALYKQYWEKKDFEGQKRKVKISTYLERLLWKGDVILEVGCGLGDNLQYLNNKGFTVWGVDKASGVVGTMGDYRDYKPNVDAIYAIHFLEHLADPRGFVEWMYERLNPGGMFVLEVPNFNDPLISLYKNKAFVKFNWYPYHHFYFTKETALRMFPKFRVKAYLGQEYGLLNHLRWLFFNRPGNTLPKIPVLDSIYAAVLRYFNMGDTLIIQGRKV